MKLGEKNNSEAPVSILRVSKERGEIWYGYKHFYPDERNGVFESLYPPAKLLEIIPQKTVTLRLLFCQFVMLLIPRGKNCHYNIK
jgi:hypothetical protein